MKTALITGSEGFVGRHITAYLEDLGWRTLGIDIVRGNDAVKYFQRGTDRFDLVVHAAYTVGGRATIDGRNTALVDNELLDASMFDWALRTRQKSVLYFSSSAAYPRDHQDVAYIVTNPLRLEDEINLDRLKTPDAHYGWAKLNGERMALVAGENGLRVHIVRPFSGYGENQSLDYPFPSIIRRAISGDFTVWGPPGQTRDWIHIDDVVAGAYAVWEADERRPVNLCTGRGVEMGELMQLAFRTARPGDTPGELVPGEYDAPEIQYLTDKPTGVFFRVGDPTRMNETYTHKIELEEGITRGIQRLTS